VLCARGKRTHSFLASFEQVLNGHAHSYERTKSVFKNKTDHTGCATTYFNLGDGGNREGPELPWREPQPMWSVFREASFGVGRLEVHNHTHMHYTWRRHACGSVQGDAPHYGMNFSAQT
jgi:hypothetical protein